MIRIGHSLKLTDRQTSSPPVWPDPLSGVALTCRLQLHRGDNIPVGVYQDVACTIPATDDFDVVAAWRDEIGGTGVVATQADLSARPLLRFEGGCPYLFFDGVNDVLFTNLTINDSGISNRGLLAMGHQYPGARIAYDTILAARPATVAIQTPGVANTYTYNWNDDISQYNWTGGPSITTGWRSYVLRVEPTEAIITLDGVSTTRTNTNTGASGTAAFCIGADFGAFRWSAVNVSSIFIAATPDDWAAIAAYIPTILP